MCAFFFVSKPLFDAASKYPQDDEPHSDIEMNVHEFTKSYDRRLMVALLVVRALTSMIVKFGSSGETVVKDLDGLGIETVSCTSNVAVIATFLFFETNRGNDVFKASVLQSLDFGFYALVK